MGDSRSLMRTARRIPWKQLILPLAPFGFSPLERDPQVEQLDKPQQLDHTMDEVMTKFKALEIAIRLRGHASTAVGFESCRYLFDRLRLQTRPRGTQL